MKLSSTKTLYEYIIKAGIHPAPHTLTRSELLALSRDPKIREKSAQLLEDTNYNIYQELQMDSAFVDVYNDINYAAENLPLHSHSFYEVIYCESGNIHYLIGGKRYRIMAGDIIFVPPGCNHRPLFYGELTTPYSRIVLCIRPEFLKALPQDGLEEAIAELHSRGQFLLRTQGSEYKFLGNYFKRCWSESEAKAPLWETSLCGNTITLLSQLIRALTSAGSRFAPEGQDDLDRIISYIEKHYTQKLTLEAVAEEFHISTSTLGKLFSSRLGISFYRFVTQRRLINAKLKIEAGCSMEEVALTCGFCDYTAFYRAFKKEYGISPRAYQNLDAHH